MASVLSAKYFTAPSRQATHQISKLLVGIAGSLSPKALTAAHVAEADEAIRRGDYTHATRRNKSSALKQILRYLWEYHGAPKLDHQVATYPGLRPRNVTATDEEINAVIAAAPPHVLLMIYLCCDLAIRSGTAAFLGFEHYDRQARELRFQTKMGARLCLPTTAEIDNLIAQCNPNDRTPFIRQLWIATRLKEGGSGRVPKPTARNAESIRHSFAELRKKLGLDRRFTYHDMRRTTAVGMLRATHDVRDVQALLGHKSLQATIWYLDHDLRPVKRHTLELIKGKRTAQSKGEQTA